MTIIEEETTTCIITRADRIRLGDVDQDKSLADNFKTVIDVYQRAQLTPEAIDELNPSEMGGAEHVITLALEVINGTIPPDEERVPSGEVIAIKRLK